MRAVFMLFGPHPNPLPQGEGEKRHALFGDRISINRMFATLPLSPTPLPRGDRGCKVLKVVPLRRGLKNEFSPPDWPA
jgi:hypothetical protein